MAQVIQLIKRLAGASPGRSSSKGFEEDIPRYPPFARGLPVASAEQLLETQAGLVRDIKVAMGMPGEKFDDLVLPVISRYAEYVHLLPASQDHHHRGAGGLFRHSLEVGFFALRASEAVVFTRQAHPSAIKKLEPRWRMASFLGGLFHDSGKPISDLTVVSPDGKHEWNVFTDPTIYEWACRLGIDRYHLRWTPNRHGRHERHTPHALYQLMTADMKGYMQEAGKEVPEALMDALTGLSVTTPLSKLIIQADKNSVEKDLREQHIGHVDLHAVGVAAERYIVSAMRSLVSEGEWKANTAGSVLWVGEDGVYINWRQAVKQVTQRLERDKIPGIPQAPESLAEILLERELAEGQRIVREGDKVELLPYWHVKVGGIDMGRGIGNIDFLALKVPTDILYSTVTPPPSWDDITLVEPDQPDTQDGPSEKIGPLDDAASVEPEKAGEVDSPTEEAESDATSAASMQKANDTPGNPEAAPDSEDLEPDDLELDDLDLDDLEPDVEEPEPAQASGAEARPAGSMSLTSLLPTPKASPKETGAEDTGKQDDQGINSDSPEEKTADAEAENDTTASAASLDAEATSSADEGRAEGGDEAEPAGPAASPKKAKASSLGRPVESQREPLSDKALPPSRALVSRLGSSPSAPVDQGASSSPLTTKRDLTKGSSNDRKGKAPAARAQSLGHARKLTASGDASSSGTSTAVIDLLLEGLDDGTCSIGERIDVTPGDNIHVLTPQLAAAMGVSEAEAVTALFKARLVPPGTTARPRLVLKGKAVKGLLRKLRDTRAYQDKRQQVEHHQAPVAPRVTAAGAKTPGSIDAPRDSEESSASGEKKWWRDDAVTQLPGKANPPRESEAESKSAAVTDGEEEGRTSAVASEQDAIAELAQQMRQGAGRWITHTLHRDKRQVRVSDIVLHDIRQENPGLTTTRLKAAIRRHGGQIGMTRQAQNIIVTLDSSQ